MEKQNVINRLNTGLKHEKLAYKIYGIVSLVLAIIIMLCSGIMMVGGAFLTGADASTNELSFNGEIIDGNADILFENGRVEINDENAHIYIDGEELTITESDAVILAGASVIIMGIVYLAFGLILLAVAIVNLVMSSKIGKYRLSDEATVKHAGSVGSIVMAAIFNEIALVFVIINFVVAKKNRAVLEG